MSDEIYNIDDLLDDETSKNLRRMGFNFPRTHGDFLEIDRQLKENPMVQPDRLKDPFAFLGKRHFAKARPSKLDDEEKDYSQNLAQAAREGKIISEEVKKRMMEDKQKSGEGRKKE